MSNLSLVFGSEVGTSAERCGREAFVCKLHSTSTSSESLLKSWCAPLFEWAMSLS